MHGIKNYLSKVDVFVLVHLQKIDFFNDFKQFVTSMDNFVDEMCKRYLRAVPESVTQLQEFEKELTKAPDDVERLQEYITRCNSQINEGNAILQQVQYASDKFGARENMQSQDSPIQSSATLGPSLPFSSPALECEPPHNDEKKKKRRELFMAYSVPANLVSSSFFAEDDSSQSNKDAPVLSQASSSNLKNAAEQPPTMKNT